MWSHAGQSKSQSYGTNSLIRSRKQKKTNRHNSLTTQSLHGFTQVTAQTISRSQRHMGPIVCATEISNYFLHSSSLEAWHHSYPAACLQPVCIRKWYDELQIMSYSPRPLLSIQKKKKILSKKRGSSLYWLSEGKNWLVVSQTANARHGEVVAEEGKGPVIYHFCQCWWKKEVGQRGFHINWV